MENIVSNDKRKEYHRKYMREYSIRNKEQITQTRHRFETNNPEKLMLKAARQRARKKNLPFNITLEDIIIPTTCPVLGMTLKFNKGSKSGGRPDSPSLDRIKPELGYVKGNVRVISHRANHLKSNATLEEHRKILLDAEANSGL